MSFLGDDLFLYYLKGVMMASKVRGYVVKCLQESKGKRFTKREIAEWISHNYPEFIRHKIDNTSVQNINQAISQITSEIQYDEYYQRDGIRIDTSSKPQRLYLFEDNISENNDEEDNLTKKREYELYPCLGEFCINKLNIKTLRIDEKKSSNKRGVNSNKWLHADVVGYEDLIQEYSEDLRDIIKRNSGIRSNLYSFEVKSGIISHSKLREYFFQTVSNSSWANYSYLVSEGLAEEAENELQLLCGSFKIGFIQLDRNNPRNSRILIQAPRKELDYDMMYRIANENSDFAKYLKNIYKEYEHQENPRLDIPQWDNEKD